MAKRSASPPQAPRLFEGDEASPQAQRPAPHWRDPYAHLPHTDGYALRPPDLAFALPWAEIEQMRDLDGFCGFTMVRRSLLLLVRRALQAKERALPQNFTLFLDFCGYDAEWLVAALRPAHSVLATWMAEHLDLCAGRLEGEAALALIGHDGLAPVWRRAGRQIVEYTAPQLAGRSLIDGPHDLRTGLWLHRRRAIYVPEEDALGEWVQH